MFVNRVVLPKHGSGIYILSTQDPLTLYAWGPTEVCRLRVHRLSHTQASGRWRTFRRFAARLPASRGGRRRPVWCGSCRRLRDSKTMERKKHSPSRQPTNQEEQRSLSTAKMRLRPDPAPLQYVDHRNGRTWYGERTREPLLLWLPNNSLEQWRQCGLLARRWSADWRCRGAWCTAAGSQAGSTPRHWWSRTSSCAHRGSNTRQFSAPRSV